MIALHGYYPAIPTTMPRSFVQPWVGALNFGYRYVRVGPQSNQGVARLLPLLPVWTGLAVDTLVFAGGWWVALTGWTRIRAWRRVRNGLCCVCAYDLRGQASGTVCPECGTTPNS